LTLVESKEEEDKVVEVKDLRFVVGSQLSQQLEGAKIDYRNSFLGSGFAITADTAPQGSC
jgi:Fe-S cluster assembly iron-binding protein IscA